MTDRRDEDVFAAEYALGLLEGADRAEAEARLRADPTFAAAVEQWHERLLPLLGDASPPPEGAWRRIEAAVSDHGPVAASAGRWRALAIMNGAIAAALAAFLILKPQPTSPVRIEPPPAMMVAALQGEDLPFALAIEVTGDSRTLRITPVSVAGETRVPQLWVIAADGVPRSLGLIASAGPSRISVPENIQALLAEGATLAVSLEPQGGAPGLVPTGPVVATGTLKSAS